MAEMIVRPTMDEAETQIFGRGKRRVGFLSASWFTAGGLGVDDEGLYLLDADGVRHALPTPPGGDLVRFTRYDTVNGNPQSGIPELFVADGNHYRLAQLPCHGFEHTDFGDLARSAGLSWVDRGRLNADALGANGGYPDTSQTVDYVGRSLAEADKHHLFRRRSS